MSAFRDAAANPIDVDAALADRIVKGRGDEESHRMAAKGIQFPWRWDSRTISTKLDVIQEIL
jgi:hypothetical protein